MRLFDPTDALRVQRADPQPRLLRADDAYAHPQLIDAGVPVADWAVYLYPPQFIDRPVPDVSRRGQEDERFLTVARAEQGFWIADCPFCPSAQKVSPLDPRFLCGGVGGCLNGRARGAYAPVVFPDDIDRVEELLLERPNRENRNWLPHETPADLQDENDAHAWEFLAEAAFREGDLE